MLLLLIAMAIASVLLLRELLVEIQNQREKTQPYRPIAQQPSRKPIQLRSKPASNQQLHQELRQRLTSTNSSDKQRLLKLLHGDASAAHRLLQHTKAGNPEKSEQWILEKTLWDLERDRLH